MLSSVIFASGCGGGGGGGTSAAPLVTPPSGPLGGFTVTGKITLADGSPLPGVSVKLFVSRYTIYSYMGVYSTKDAGGIESLATGTTPSATVSTAADGTYAFHNVPANNYTITPELAPYLFKWKLVPTKNSIGVLTLTDSPKGYFYDPNGTGNQITPLGPIDYTTIIYNTVPPFDLPGNSLSGPNLDFEGAIPGGGSGGTN